MVRMKITAKNIILSQNMNKKGFIYIIYVNCKNIY